MTEIDFHAHILPGCDHGSDGWETSRRQLVLARKAGVGMICATSHFYGHHTSVERFLQKRQRCYETLMAHVPENAPGWCWGRRCWPSRGSIGCRG